VADVGERNWQRVIPFFEFPEEIRKIIYTTNAVESLHMTLRKVTKKQGVVSESGSCNQTDLSGAPERIEEVAHGPGMARGAPAIYPPLA